MERVDITIVGAGAVGLSIAAELSRSNKSVCVVERHHSFGEETSSRNSEVIHAGLYYSKDSLKTKSCLEGRNLLYQFCDEYRVPYKKIGKLVVAINQDEVKEVEDLFQNARNNGVTDVRLLSGPQVKALEPHVDAASALYSPSTGIFDSHAFMKALVSQFEASGGSLAYQTEVTGIEKTNDGFTVSVRDEREGAFSFSSRIVVNSAGLSSDKVSALAGFCPEEYRIKYCKGDYFRVSGAKAKFLNRLVYPVPKKNRAGLGIHATPDMSGSVRLGPDDEYVDVLDYQVNPLKAKSFYEGTRDFLPFLSLQDIAPDTAGIRPKLQGKNEPFRDFIVKDEAENGFPGLINLIGIESPGLTASLSLAKLVGSLVKKQGV